MKLWAAALEVTSDLTTAATSCAVIGPKEKKKGKPNRNNVVFFVVHFSE